MSVTPGPERLAIRDPERASGRGARVEDRVHMADEQRPAPAGPAPELADDRVAERGVFVARDGRAEPFHEPGHPAPDLVDARACV